MNSGPLAPHADLSRLWGNFRKGTESINTAFHVVSAQSFRFIAKHPVSGKLGTKWVQKDAFLGLPMRQAGSKRVGTEGVQRTHLAQKGLTATRVASLPPGRYKDPGQASLYLLVRAREAAPPSRTWLHRVKTGGKAGRDTFITIGHFPETSLELARDTIRRHRELLSKGIDPRRAAPRRQPPGPLAMHATNDHSIEFLVSEFITRYLRPHRKRPEYAEAILAKDVLPRWKGRDARTIEPTEVLELLDGIVERGSKVMANRTAALLAQLFKFGIHRRIVRATPVQLLFRPGGKEKARKRVLGDEELRAYLADSKACTRYERLSHVIAILLLTGQRRGELARAKWSEIDFQARTWTIPDENAKGDEGHAVPLAEWTVRELESLQRLAQRSPWVLPANGSGEHIDPKQLTRSLAKCLERFKERGIEAFTLHDLRRTCRTGLARLKVEPHIAERVLNHVQPGIVGVYDRFAYVDEKRAALELWATHLASLKTGNATVEAAKAA
ncbi:MAG: tyrosine-type recombinase/integrase [Steroidobacteraceae bacterium]